MYTHLLSCVPATPNKYPEPTKIQDEDSQAILSLLQCTNSRLGLSGSLGGGAVTSGDRAGMPPGDAPAAGGGGSKRRSRDQYLGELNAQEVENGFGMGMSSKVGREEGGGGREGGWVRGGGMGAVLFLPDPYLRWFFFTMKRKYILYEPWPRVVNDLNSYFFSSLLFFSWSPWRSADSVHSGYHSLACALTASKKTKERKKERKRNKQTKT